jgi:monovalent cation/hydrogen antiporter
MLEHFPFYLAVIVLIVLLIMLSNRIKVAYPVLLVLAGLIMSFIPGIPVLKIDPELIFIIFLPPLLYEAAWERSWKELWHWRRIITSFAFVVVFLTAISVAFVANYFIPGFSLALGFLLGGIVSPPDAVSAGAILKFVNAPKRLSSILEGESLLNDASSLIVFRFAMAAVATGQFIWHEAALSFGWMVVGGVGIGLLIGLIFKKLNKYLPTDVNMDIILSLVAPYAMYIVAEKLHSSGVLAVVSGGLFLSRHRHYFLSGASRLRGENVWQSLIFLLNGLVFIMIGLDLSEILEGLGQEGISVYDATLYGVLITAVLVIGRMLAAYGALITTWIASRFITVADKNPGLKAPFILGYAGMRGVVSLAAALSIPATLNGEPFPQRNLILYITFVVILLTLVIQGLTLPILLKKITVPGYNDYLPEDETERLIRTTLARKSLEFIDTYHKDCLDKNMIIKQLHTRWEFHISSGGQSGIDEGTRPIYREVLEMQRRVLIKLDRDTKNIDEDIVKKHLHQIDLEEEKLNH